MKTRDDRLYFRYIEQAYDHLKSGSSDVGMLSWSALGNLSKIAGCKHNPNRPSSSSAWRCGKCRVCMEEDAKRRAVAFASRLPDLPGQPYVLLTLALPKRVKALVEQVKGERSGELFFVTDSLFSSGSGWLESSMRRLRDAGLRAIQDCCGGVELALVWNLHFDDGYMVFSPHLHVILCPVAFAREVWPFPKGIEADSRCIRDAWRNVLSPETGLPVRKLARRLRQTWADALAVAAREMFTDFQSRFKPGVPTRNLAYRHFAGGNHDMDRLEAEVRQAVLADRNCVDVKRLSRDYVRHEWSPGVALRSGLKYGLLRAEKALEYRESRRGGLVVARQTRKGSKSASCGPLALQYRRLAQLHSPRRCRTSSLKGWAACKDRRLRRVLLDAVSNGFRRKSERFLEQQVGPAAGQASPAWFRISR